MNIKLSPPWIEYMHKITVLFEKDPQIKIITDNKTPEIKLLIDSQKKYEALSKLLPVEKWFGNVKLKITLVPSNNVTLAGTEDTAQLYADAFEGNPILSCIVPVRAGIFSNAFSYVAFVKEVVQFFNDNLADLHGNKTTLFETIANEIFEDKKNGICFCTDVDKKGFGAPLGEWP